MVMHIYFYWMPMAKQLYTVTKQAGIDVEFSVQENIRYQFPTEMYTLKELVRRSYKDHI